jgi:2-iminobutanoate/2-iminopropanoate deaminase
VLVANDACPAFTGSSVSIAGKCLSVRFRKEHTLTSHREEFRVASLGQPISHYTDAVRHGNLLFISGCGPFDEQNRIVGGDDAAEQCRQVLENIGKILAAANASFADVLKVTVYLTDVGDREVINPVRKEFFGTTRPASTLIGVAALVFPGMKVEIDAVAALGGRP